MSVKTNVTFPAGARVLPPTVAGPSLYSASPNLSALAPWVSFGDLFKGVEMNVGRVLSVGAAGNEGYDRCLVRSLRCCRHSSITAAAVYARKSISISALHAGASVAQVVTGKKNRRPAPSTGGADGRVRFPATQRSRKKVRTIVT
jgi:hypothetical protein